MQIATALINESRRANGKVILPSNVAAAILQANLRADESPSISEAVLRSSLHEPQASNLIKHLNTNHLKIVAHLISTYSTGAALLVAEALLAPKGIAAKFATPQSHLHCTNKDCVLCARLSGWQPLAQAPAVEIEPTQPPLTQEPQCARTCAHCLDAVHPQSHSQSCCQLAKSVAQ